MPSPKYDARQAYESFTSDGQRVLLIESMAKLRRSWLAKCPICFSCRERPLAFGLWLSVVVHRHQNVQGQRPKTKGRLSTRQTHIGHKQRSKQCLARKEIRVTIVSPYLEALQSSLDPLQRGLFLMR